jgi:transposase
MLKPIKEQLIRELYKNGVSKRAIARQLGIARDTVKKVLAVDNIRMPAGRDSRYEHHIDQIRELFTLCTGNVVRVQEELASRYNIDIPYQTLTWLVRKYEMRAPVKQRAGRYHRVPGGEMQHDTSPHKIKIGNRVVTAQCSALTLAYSRMLFVQYYPRFTRFECRVFLTEALAYMQGSCRRCVIDNTSVIVGHGAGANAVMAPEMEHFGRIYGMHFMAHRVGHADRKGRVERPFHYVENNFLAGRTFKDWDDLNNEVRNWCVRTANRKLKRRLGMSPQEAWVIEKPSLVPLPPVQPPVYVSFQRTVDVEGYVHLDTNRYSVPDTLIGHSVEVHKYWDMVRIYHKRSLIAEHKRSLEGRDRRITCAGHHRPLTRSKAHRGPCEEEKILTGRSNELDQYIKNMKKKVRGRGVVQMKRLLELKRTYPEDPFMHAVREALHYGMYDLARLENMILRQAGTYLFDLQ